MNPKSLLIIFTHPPQVRVQNALLEDNVSTKIDETPVYAGVAPWNPMHDLLIDRETRTLAGIVYPVATQEQAAIAAVCRALPPEVVRYCISPVSAAALLRDQQRQLTDSLSMTGDPNAPVKQFPESLRPYRQMLRSCFLGETEPERIPLELRSVAGEYFQDAAAAEHLDEWANGGATVERVEVTWANKPVHASLPSYFPSAFDIELAQLFAEDIWFYREDDQRVFGIGVNHLDKTLADYGLRLPKN